MGSLPMLRHRGPALFCNVLFADISGMKWVFKSVVPQLKSNLVIRSRHSTTVGASKEFQTKVD